MYRAEEKQAKLTSTPRCKAATLRASPSIVGVVTHDVPADMTDDWQYAVGTTRKYAFREPGVIIENQLDATASAPTYITTILAPAVLFKRSNHLQPHQVPVDVYACDGNVHKGELLVCDFHYNLAAIRFQSSSCFQPITLMPLSDVSSLDVNAYAQSRFQLHPHSPFKIQPEAEIMILRCLFDPSFSVLPVSARFRAECLYYSESTCKELYNVQYDGIERHHSGAVINLFGECLGIFLGDFAFLPSNFISRWWINYTTNSNLCRPWIGVQVANLAETRLSFLEQLRNRFPDISTGAVVTKVKEDTPAYSSGVLPKDVIVKCNDKLVQSKIEFFENMWDNAGKAVKLTVVRGSELQPLELCISIGETTPANFYQWMLPSFSSEIIAFDESSGSEEY